MREAIFTPEPALARHVQLFCVMEMDEAEAFGEPERILPDGIVEICTHR